MANHDLPETGPTRPLSADIAAASLRPQTITVSAAEYDRLVDALDAPARPMPRLAALLAEAPRWS